MERSLLSFLRELYEKWNVKGIILLSLFLQFFLVLFGTQRRRSAGTMINMFTWMAYLLADWAGRFALGLIAKNGKIGIDVTSNFLAFWAPFLLVHLGGPDTITAFSLEDNELWDRQLLAIVFQVGTAAYIYSQALKNNVMWLSTMLVFLVGAIKSGERTRALYLASRKRFRNSMLTDPDPGPNYAKLMDEYSSSLQANLKAKIITIPEPKKASKFEDLPREIDLSDFKVVKEAYRCFDTFRRLIVDLIFSFRERDESRDFFCRINARDALSLIAVELNFFYDVLYTKTSVVRNKSGYFFRFICFALTFGALALFYLADKKGTLVSHLSKGSPTYLDDKKMIESYVGITYTLLLGAVGFDVIAYFRLVFSDWTIAAIHEKSFMIPIIDMYLYLRKPSSWSSTENSCTYLGSIKKRLFGRWSESIPSYKLIDYCLAECPQQTVSINRFACVLVNTVATKMGMKDLLDKLVYVERYQFENEMWDFIFSEIKDKSKIASDHEIAKGISSARGDWILRDVNYSKLMPYVSKVEFDESLLLWHIATDLCYAVAADHDRDTHRWVSKILSDYMLYLLVMQQTMLSPIGGIGQIRFRDTCAEAMKFFSMIKKRSRRKVCIDILAVNTNVKPSDVKGDRSKSLLFDACRLAKELMNLEKADMWKTVSRVWVEMLAFAACRCPAAAHCQQLSKGGELLTFVWLLMAHFGLGDQFQINEGHATAKLIVRK